MTNAHSAAAAHDQPRKRPGPSPSGTPDIRKGILDASEYLFATQGFSATSIRAIAERVDVNPAMVHYYFGSKKKLLQAVMEHVLEPMAGAVAEVEERGDLPVRELTQLLFSMAADHPYLPQLITREVFLPGGELQSEFLERFAPRLGGRLPGMLRREQREGRLAPDVDPQIMSLLVLSLCFFPFIARPVAQAVLDVRYDAPGLRMLAEHVMGLLERGLR
jgi:AcrR family transcriptional regulator